MNNRRTIITIGMFDGVHRGHRHLLEQLDRHAKNLNMQPAVITFEEHPLTVINPEKTPKLLFRLGIRHSLLGSFYGRKVFVIENKPEIFKLTAKEFVLALKEQINVKAVLLGYNSTFGSDQIKDPEELAKELDSIGVDTYLAEKFEKYEVSSSSIRKLVEEGDIPKANKMLGTLLRLDGKVVKGQQIGTKLGFPTANLEVDEKYIIPGNGVYAVYCLGYSAMLNIGTAPTIRKNGKKTIEVHIIEGTNTEEDAEDIKNLYGKKLDLIVIKKIREEKEFNSTEELKEQLEKDRKEAIRVCDEFMNSRIEME